MNIIRYPDPAQWDELLRRPALDVTTLNDTVRTVLQEVRARGDEAVKEFEERFDHVRLDSLMVSDAEWAEADTLVSDELKEALRQAHANIEKFHAAQRFESRRVTVTEGVTC